MADHKLIPDAELHQPKGIQLLTGGAADAGKVIVAVGDGTSETRYLTLQDVSQSTAVTYVTSEDDLPPAVGGVIDLGSDVTYLIMNAFTVNSRLEYGENVTINHLNSGVNTITYTGVLPLFTNTVPDARLTVQFAAINAPNAALLDMKDVVGSGTAAFTDGVIVAASLGVANNAQSVRIDRVLLTLATDGITFTGGATNPVWDFVNSQASIAAGTFVDITAVEMQAFRIDFSAIVETAAGVTAINSAGAVDILSTAVAVVQNSLLGVTTPLAGGVATTSARWRFQSADPLADSVIGAATYITTQETVTINTSGVFEKVEGTNWVGQILTEELVAGVDGTVTYTGTRPLPILIVTTVTMEAAGGTDSLSAKVALNDVVIDSSEGITENSLPTQVSCNAIVTLTNGDELSLYVANNDATTDILVEIATMNMISVV